MLSLLQAQLWTRLKRWRARGRGEPRSRWTTRRTKTDRTSPRLWAACSPVFRPWRAPNASPIPSGRNSPVTPVSRWIVFAYGVCRRGGSRSKSAYRSHPGRRGPRRRSTGVVSRTREPSSRNRSTPIILCLGLNVKYCSTGYEYQLNLNRTFFVLHSRKVSMN